MRYYLRKKPAGLAAFCLTLFFISSCAPLIGPYSPTAYENATSLKAETLALMDKAAQPYSEHEKEIERLKVEIDKAYEYANGIQANNISARQWEILKNPDGDLLGKFFLRWKERGTLSETIIQEFKGVVADAFDEIICLEVNKGEAKKCTEKKGE